MMGVSRGNIYEIFFTKLALNLKAESSRTYLGYIWWVLEPALYVLVLYLVFTMLISRGTNNFVVFLLCGTIPFLWFSKTIANATGSILDGYGLICALPIPKAFFPLLVVVQDSVKQAFVFVLFFCFLVLYGDVQPQLSWLHIVPLILVQFLFISSTALVVAAITPYVPDFRYIVPTGTLLVMFGSGLFYSYEVVIPEAYWSVFLANPMANIINNYRMILLENAAPDWVALAVIAMVSVAIGLATLLFLRAKDSTISRLVIQ